MFRVVLALWLVLLTACGDDPGDPPRRGCAPDTDASGTYRFSPAYLDERLLHLEEALAVEERPFDRGAMTVFVDGMQAAWANATLVLAPDGTFALVGVALPEFEPAWHGTWEVLVDPRECTLLLTGPDDSVHALLGEGWTILWKEEPQPGIVLDVLLVRDGEDGDSR